MEIILSRKWEAAHRFYDSCNSKSLCALPHGHTWNLKVYLKAPAEFRLDKSSNMLESFESLKRHWHSFVDHSLDHSFKLNHKDPFIELLLKENPEARLIVCPGDPTTELLSVLLKAKITAILKEQKSKLVCRKVLIQETQTNAVSFSGAPEDHFPLSEYGNAWWNQANPSTR